MIDKSKFYQPTGEIKVILFRNNTIHRGGFCKKGFIEMLYFHIYPSKNKINWDKVLVDGLKKTSIYIILNNKKY